MINDYIDWQGERNQMRKTEESTNSGIISTTKGIARHKIA